MTGTRNVMRRVVSALVLAATVAGCSDDDPLSVDPAPPNQADQVEALNRRLDLRNVPGRHVQAWDAMFDLDRTRAAELLTEHITSDSFVTFKLPEEAGGDRNFEPGVEGWINLVVGSAEAGGWVPAAPGYPRALHMIGSVLVLEETTTTAVLQAYVRASHYQQDTAVDTSEAVLQFDVIWDDDANRWLVAHLDLTPLSLRDEGGMVLPPVTSFDSNTRK